MSLLQIRTQPMSRRRAFTLTEQLVGILVMTILSAVELISPRVATQTAKREAERVRAYLYRVIQAADRRGINFNLDTFKDYISVKWMGKSKYEETFKPPYGCTYSDNLPGKYNVITYNAKNMQFNAGGTITVKGADGKTCSVIIASTEGRIRIEQ